MEKRKENARYLNQCFTMMVLLNCIIVLFLAFTIVLTQYRVAAAQEAQQFIETLKVMPERPEQKIIMVVFSLCFLCGIIYYKRRNEEEGKEKVLLWNIFEIIFLIFVLKELDMTYNGVIFLIVADMLTYVEDRKNKLIFLFISFLCYMVCSYNLVTMFIPLNSFETWVAFYDGETESLFLGVKTICEILNMILFLVYIVILMMKDRRERERIQLLNAQLQKANEQLHEFAQEKELMGETKERNRLAREIHDTLGHALTGISAGIDAVKVLVDIDTNRAKEQLNNVSVVVRDGIRDVRGSLNKMRPGALENNTLKEALIKIIREYEAISNLEIHLLYKWDNIDLDIAKEDIVFRVIQESITNSVRHGHAKTIWIELLEEEEAYVMTIQDDGVGFDELYYGYGLKQMQERLMIIGGSVRFENRDGFYTHIKIPKIGGRHD